MRCGLAPADFWRSTPFEVARVIEADAWRLRREQKRTIFGAWSRGYLDRRKDGFPQLDVAMRELGPPGTNDDERPRQTLEEQLNIVRFLNALHGGQWREPAGTEESDG